MGNSIVSGLANSGKAKTTAETVSKAVEKAGAEGAKPAQVQNAVKQALVDSGVDPEKVSITSNSKHIENGIEVSLNGNSVTFNPNITNSVEAAQVQSSLRGILGDYYDGTTLALDSSLSSMIVNQGAIERQNRISKGIETILDVATINARQNAYRPTISGGLSTAQINEINAMGPRRTWGDLASDVLNNPYVASTIGALQAVEGGILTATGVTLSASGWGAVVGVPLAAFGADQMQAGWRTVYNRGYVDSYTNQGLQSAGLSPLQAGIAEAVLGTGGSLAAVTGKLGNVSKASNSSISTSAAQKSSMFQGEIEGVKMRAFRILCQLNF